MPRLGVPSTTDSASRLHATVVANRPPAAVDKSPRSGRLGGTFRRTLEARIESRERDETKALPAAAHLEPPPAPHAPLPTRPPISPHPPLSPPPPPLPST